MQKGRPAGFKVQKMPPFRNAHEFKRITDDDLVTEIAKMLGSPERG
jgi:hypothetical protein